MLGSTMHTCLFAWQERPSLKSSHLEVSDYFIGGFARYTPKTQSVVSAIAVAAYVPDSVLVSLLEDDRVCRRSKELKETLKEELQWLNDLSAEFWQRLGSISGSRAVSVRSKALRVATVAAGYINKKIFAVVEEYPWRLAIGDVRANLVQLQAVERSSVRHPVALKIKQLLAMGYNEHQLVEAIGLFREVPWTTTGVEQGHGSTAAMHKGHARLGPEQLCARSFLHSLRTLLQPPPPGRDEQLQAQAESLKRKEPEKVSGRHMFFKELRAQAQSNLPQGEKLSLAVSQALLAQHGSVWNSLSPAAQSVYNRSAQRFAAEARQALVDEVSGLEAWGEIRIRCFCFL